MRFVPQIGLLQDCYKGAAAADALSKLLLSLRATQPGAWADETVQVVERILAGSPPLDHVVVAGLVADLVSQANTKAASLKFAKVSAVVKHTHTHTHKRIETWWNRNFGQIGNCDSVFGNSSRSTPQHSFSFFPGPSPRKMKVMKGLGIGGI